jgi:hypothetical protein
VWAGIDGRPEDWAVSYLTGREDLSRSFPVLGGDLATGPGWAAALPASRVGIESDHA